MTQQYASAKVLLRSNIDNRLLMLSRNIDGLIGYEPAGGKVEIDFKLKISETFEQCAIREIREELNIESKITHYVGSYYYFWSIRENVCSQCILFLGDIISGEVTTAAQEACGILSPVWVSMDDIKGRKIPVRNYHIGLEDLLVKAVNMISPQ